jgi:hypothetical protein
MTGLRACDDGVIFAVLVSWWSKAPLTHSLIHQQIFALFGLSRTGSLITDELFSKSPMEAVSFFFSGSFSIFFFSFLFREMPSLFPYLGAIEEKGTCISPRAPLDHRHLLQFVHTYEPGGAVWW